MDSRYNQNHHTNESSVPVSFDPSQGLRNLSANQLRELADQQEALEYYARLRENNRQGLPPQSSINEANLQTAPSDQQEALEYYARLRENQHQGLPPQSSTVETNFQPVPSIQQPYPPSASVNTNYYNRADWPPSMSYQPGGMPLQQAISHNASPYPENSFVNLSISDTHHGSESSFPPLSTQSSGSNSITDEQILGETLEFTNRTPPPLESIPRLSKPVGIPQVTQGTMAPFVRAFAPALMNHDIIASEFLAFVDGLNVVSTGSPPIQALGLAGSIAGMAPEPVTAMVGSITELTAELGTVVVSKARSTIYISNANKDFFHPRKLHVIVCSADDLAKMTNIPKGQAMAAPLDASTMNMSILERRMAALELYISPLTTNVPPRTAQLTRLQKMCDKQVEKEARKADEKALKDRRKALVDPSKSSSDIHISPGHVRISERSVIKEVAKVQDKLEQKREKVIHEAEENIAKERSKGKEHKVAKELNKRNDKLAKLEREYGKDIAKEQRHHVKKDKELKAARKGKWIVIRAWDGDGSSR